jgi:hypothetical protein
MASFILKFELQGQSITMNEEAATTMITQLVETGNLTVPYPSGAQFTFECADRERKVIKRVVLARCVISHEVHQDRCAVAFNQTLTTLPAISIRQLHATIVLAREPVGTASWQAYVDAAFPRENGQSEP